MIAIIMKDLEAKWANPELKVRNSLKSTNIE